MLSLVRFIQTMLLGRLPVLLIWGWSPFFFRLPLNLFSPNDLCERFVRVVRKNLIPKMKCYKTSDLFARIWEAEVFTLGLGVMLVVMVVIVGGLVYLK